MLVSQVKDGSALLAHYGAVSGKEDISRRMSENFHEDFMHLEAISVALHKKVKDMAKSAQPVGATTSSGITGHSSLSQIEARLQGPFGERDRGEN